MANDKLGLIDDIRNDELYTRLSDIETEIAAYTEFNPDVFRDKTILLPCDNPQKSNFTKFFARNFEKLGLKKLISTTAAPDYKNKNKTYQKTIFNKSAVYTLNLSKIRGKIFTVERETFVRGLFDIGDPEWWYLEDDGDFRSDEIKNFRDEADIIITYPPASLFGEFMSWLFEADKKFIIIANKNCLENEEIAALLKESKIWQGKTENPDGLWFETTDYNYFDREAAKINMEKASVLWLTNIKHSGCK